MRYGLVRRMDKGDRQRRLQRDPYQRGIGGGAAAGPDYLVARAVHRLGENMVFHPGAVRDPGGRRGAGGLPAVPGQQRGVVEELAGGIELPGRHVPPARRRGGLVIRDQHPVHHARGQVRGGSGDDGQVAFHGAVVHREGDGGSGEREVGGHVGRGAVGKAPVAGLVPQLGVHLVINVGIPGRSRQLPPGAVGAERAVDGDVVPDFRRPGVSPVGYGTVPILVVRVALDAHVHIVDLARPVVGRGAGHLAGLGDVQARQRIGNRYGRGLHLVDEGMRGAHFFIVAGPVAAFRVQVIDQVGLPHVVVGNGRQRVGVGLGGGVESPV